MQCQINVVPTLNPLSLQLFPQKQRSFAERVREGPFKATGNGGQQRHHERRKGERTAGAEVDDESHAMMDAEAKCGKRANFDGGKANFIIGELCKLHVSPPSKVAPAQRRSNHRPHRSATLAT